MRFRSLWIGSSLLSMTGTAWWGCSASDSDTTGSGGGPGDATSSTGTGTSQGGGGAGPSSGSGIGGLLDTDSGKSDAVDEGCAAEDVQAELVQLDMVILLDRSGSMSGTKWDGSTTALKTFVNDPASAGINVGIEYFPIDNPPDGNDCNFIHYETLAVDVAALPGNAPALVTSIDFQDPNGGDTPTYGGLKGALFVATGLQDANPDHKVIVVLASDGDPNSCPANQNDIPVIAGLAKSAFNYNGVQTYAIAIAGSTVANLNQIAAAGGTTAAFDVTNDISLFSQKMKEIQAAALTCEFNIPPPPRGETLDPTLVNVSYTPGGLGNPTKIPKADDLADCGSGEGWYYDSAANPTKIILCPASCKIVQADTKAKMSVAFGCVSTPN